jgi:O-antigen/teichoic acid export membrane protein
MATADRPSTESTPPVSARSASRRVAANTLVQVAGEVVSRLLLFAFFAIMVRRLGAGGFGDFTFALSLTGLMLVTDSAVDDVLTRDVARHGMPGPRLVGDALMAKITVGGALGAFAIAYSFAGGYSWTVRAVVSLLVLGSVAELVGTTSYATLRGLEDFRTGTLGLLIMRAARATAGIAVLLLGGGLVLVAATYAGGAFVALAYAGWALGARGNSPRPDLSRGATSRVMRRAGPLLMAGVVDTVVVSLGPIVLSAVSGSAAVGAYGAAIRLGLITQFLGIALAAAVLPIFARSNRTSTPPLGEMVQVTLKVTIAALLPVAAFLALFAAPVVELVFGHGFTSAVTPTRILAPLALVPAVAMVASVVLLARNRLTPLIRVPIVVLVVDVILLAALVPAHAEIGAAIALLVAEVLYAALLIVATVRVTGPLSLVRMAGGPAAGCAAMVAAVAALGGGAAGVAVALVGYGVALLLWERARYPGDLDRVAALVLRLPRSA